MDDILDRLEAYNDLSPETLARQHSVSELLERCKDSKAQNASLVEPVRTLHHFACTGGTILSKCIAAQANTVLLSEIDPFSEAPLRKVDFAPYDILKQSQTSFRPLDHDGVEATFIGGLSAMYENISSRGQFLVVRDHAHSHFCTMHNFDDRQSLLEILVNYFDVTSIVSVRHPLDSYLSLKKNNWITFSPGSLEEYCKRYLQFLSRYDGVPIIVYEEFVLKPEKQAQKIMDLLKLPYSSDWTERLSLMSVTGDSGRSGDSIGPRERSQVPDEIAEACTQSSSYKALCATLNYSPDIIVSPYDR